MSKKLSAIIASAAVIISIFHADDMQAQSMRVKGYNTVSTAVTFLTVSPDSRSGALGDIGAATTPDINSMHYNPAKFAFMGLKPGADPTDYDAFTDENAGFVLNYSPWMTQLSPDINLFNVAGYYKLNDKSAIAASMTYFSMGEIEFTDEYGASLGLYHPNEFAIDATYSRKFSEKISGAVAGRFIYSDLTQGVDVNSRGTKAGMSAAADIAMYYVEPMQFGKLDGNFALGVNIANIGSKLSYYTDKSDKEFIPTTLRISPVMSINIDDFNTFSFGVEFTKFLVPTTPISEMYDETTGITTYKYGYDETAQQVYGKNDDVSTIMGMIQSFYDAPGYSIVNDSLVPIGGFLEELQEINIGVGVEYWYNNLLAIRAGYFYENPRKGDRQYITLGAGLKYNVFGLDVSYLVSTTNTNPLGNTLRFSISLNFGN